MLHLIRHGETALNVARVLQPAHTPLSQRGRAQARALAERLVPLRLSAIISSDLPRALQTAEAIAAACALPIETSALLHERNFGDLRGRPYDTLGYDPIAADEAPPGGESMAEFEARAAQAWQRVLQAHALAGGPIAVVTHGLVLKAWLRPGLIDLGGMSLPMHLANTALSTVQARPPHRVHTLACARHLQGMDGDDARSLVGG